jgi:hypothetical protein
VDSGGWGGPNPNELGRLAREERKRRENATDPRWMLDEDDQGVDGPRRRRGLMERLRVILGRGDSSVRRPKPDVSGEDMWEAERRHRRETEQDQAGGRDGTLPRTRRRG